MSKFFENISKAFYLMGPSVDRLFDLRLPERFDARYLHRSLGSYPSTAWSFLPLGSIGMSRQHSAGKGDSPRKVDQQKYRENYEKIFGKKKNQSTKKKKKA